MIFFSCAKRRLSSYGSIKFFRNESYMSADSFNFQKVYTNEASQLISNHSPPPQVTVLMFVIMHFHNHSMHKSLFLCVREGILIIILIKTIIPMAFCVVAPGILLSALKSWLQLILTKYDKNGNYSWYI